MKNNIFIFILLISLLIVNTACSGDKLVSVDKIGIFFSKCYVVAGNDTLETNVDGYEILIREPNEQDSSKWKLCGTVIIEPNSTYPFKISKSLLNITDGKYEIGYRGYIENIRGKIMWSLDPSNIYGIWRISWYEILEILKGSGIGIISVKQN